MTNEGLCPRCNEQEESIMHAIRDCECIKEVWNVFVEEANWSCFFSQGLSSWMLTNLSKNYIHNRGISWPLLFGVIVWLLWKDRCNLVFNNRSNIPDSFALMAISAASQVANSLVQLDKPLKPPKAEHLIRWWPPKCDSWKLNTDGSVFQSDSRAACGGLIRDHSGKPLAGFFSSLGICSSVRAELWGILKGLRLASSYRLNEVVVEMDSKTAHDLITIRCSHSHPCIDLVKDIQYLASLNWTVSFHHIYREANRCADHLARLGHSPPGEDFDSARVPS